jgi:mediator of RNA polymerase II transcription subunit 5
MHRYCQNKETAPLKELCNLIVRKPDTVEIMALFSPAAYILGPLCSLLDDWKWDDLHGEYE